MDKIKGAFVWVGQVSALILFIIISIPMLIWDTIKRFFDNFFYGEK